MILLYSLYNRGPSYHSAARPVVQPGLHCLNEMLTFSVASYNIYKCVFGLDVFNGGGGGWLCVCVYVYNEYKNLHNARPWTGES